MAQTTMVTLDVEGIFLAVDVTANLDLAMRSIFTRVRESEQVGFLLLEVQKTSTKELGELKIDEE